MYPIPLFKIKKDAADAASLVEGEEYGEKLFLII